MRVHTPLVDDIQLIERLAVLLSNNLDDEPHLDEMSAEDEWIDLLTSFFEDNHDKIIAKMPLPLHLLWIGWTERQQRRHVEHDFDIRLLLRTKCREDRMPTSRPRFDVQSSTEAFKAVQIDAVAQKREKLIKIFAAMLVVEHFVLRHLTLLAVEDAEFVSVLQRLLLKREELIIQLAARIQSNKLDVVIGDRFAGLFDGFDNLGGRWDVAR